jgi:hypothetical protein
MSCLCVIIIPVLLHLCILPSFEVISTGLPQHIRFLDIELFAGAILITPSRAHDRDFMVPKKRYAGKVP